MTNEKMAETLAKRVSLEWFGPNPPTPMAYSNLEHDIMSAIPLVKLIRLAKASSEYYNTWKSPLKEEELKDALIDLRKDLPNL